MAPKQLNIFSHSGLHTVVRDMKEALRDEVRDTGLSRDQILDKINAAGRRHGILLTSRGDLSKDLFEKYLNPEDDRAPGIKGLALLCAVLETVRPLDAIASTVGGKVIGPDDAKLLEWARAYQDSRLLRRKMKRLEEDL